MEPGQPSSAKPEQRDRVSRAVAGDKDALGELLEQFGPDVEAGLTISPTWNGQLDTADVMQVTYMEAFLQIGRFDPARPESFGGWLRQMAHNNLCDAIRSLEARKNPPARLRLDAFGGDTTLALFDALTFDSVTPSRAVRRDEAGELLRQAIQCLPPDYARTIQLYDLDDRPIEEVAAEMRRSTGAIYMLRSRALDCLRNILGPATQILESRG